MQKERKYMTRAVLSTFIKHQPRGTEFCISIRNEAPVVDDAGELQTWRRYGLCTYVDVSRRQALAVVDRMLSYFEEEKGSRIPIYTSGSEGKTIVWIGA